MGSGCQPWMNTVGGGGVGVWVLCVFVSLCACNFVHPTTNFPSILLPPCHGLACHFRALPPLPSTQPPFPSALSISMKNSDSDDYAALFFFFLSFCNTTVVRWPFLHAARMQPSDRRAQSAHPHTQQHTLLHTYPLIHRRPRA